MRESPVPRRSSLRLRLPLLVCALILGVLTPFFVVAYLQVTSTLIRTRSDRAQAAADQVANLFAQSSRQRLNEVQRVGANPVIRLYLERPTPDAEPTVSQLLRSLVSTGHQIIELWNGDGGLALSVAVPAAANGVMPQGRPPFAPGNGPLRSADNKVFSELVAVISRDGTGPKQGAPPLGYLVARRLSTSATASDTLGRLVGVGASITMGNQSGDVWTDLSSIVPAPPLNLRQPGASQFRGGDGTRRLAAVSTVRDTPWSVSVAFPYALVVEPAALLARRMSVAAGLFLLLSFALTAAVTRRITTPLAELTAAAEGIARGNYASHVSVSRRDEIGRLAHAFNQMAENVETGRSRLEAQARELTESREAAERQKMVLESVLARMRDGVAVADRTGSFISFNKAGENILGVGAVDGGEDTWPQAYGVFRPDGVTPFPAHELPLARAISGETCDNVEMVIRNHHLDHPVLINCYGRPLFDSSGGPLGGVAIFEDVTERHRAETALRERERDFRSLFAESPLPSWVYDRATLRFLEVNDAAVQAYGYSRREFLAMSLKDIRPEEDIPRLMTDVARPRQRMEPPTYWRHRVKSGAIIDVEIVSHELTFDNRPAIKVVAHNVTERRRVERALVDSEAHKAAVISAALDCIVTMDHQGTIMDFNPAAESSFGYSREEAIGQPLADLLIPDRLRDQHRRGISRYLSTGEDHVIGRRVELPALRKSGAEFPAEVSISAVRRLGSPIFTAFIRDLTEQKAAEEARIQSLSLAEENRRVQEASRLKSEFLANMSHELRTPLNAIIGFAELLHDGQVSPDMPEFKDFLHDILTSGQHLLQLINDVLDLAKVEAGRLEFHPEPVDIDQTIAEVLGILRTMASNKRLSVAHDVEPAVRLAVVDRGRLKQVLYNYLSNAMKFTPNGGQVQVRVRPDGAAHFRLEVEDSGIGIAPGDIGRLFEEFQQLEPGTAKKQQGTGLGLALTKRLVEAQGGTVGVTSTPGVGSVFFARMPLQAAMGAPMRGPRSFPAAVHGAPCVLIIEDNESDQNALVGTLTAAGFAVETASTGAQALAKCQERSFDAITLDLLLPDANGVEVLRQIRAGSINRDVPIIVITVVAADGVMNGHAVQDILAKPVEGVVLVESLRRAGVSARHGEVLVVDDDSGSLRLMAASLGQLGYQCSCVTSGAEGLRVAQASAPLVVILDLMMPEMDGFAFLSRFRELPDCERVPVIVWTIKDLSQEDYERLGASAQGVISKGQAGAKSVLDELRRYVPPQRSL